MNLFFAILSVFLAAIVLGIGLTMSACESDPLLAPQTEVADEGGSYGNTNLPPSGATEAKDLVNPAQDGRAGDTRRQNTNPKRF